MDLQSSKKTARELCLCSFVCCARFLC